jgi:MFS family permease
MHTIIMRPRLLGLLLSGVATLFVGMSLFPLFPPVAAELGAGSALIGIALAVIYIASALGPAAAGLLARRVGRKPLFIAAGLAGPPAVALFGQAQALWQAVVLMAIAWFCGGIILTLLNLFTGIYAEATVRGRAYALMALATPLGALLGGAVTTALLSRLNLAVACLAMALVWGVAPLMGLLALDSRAEQGGRASSAAMPRRRASGAFWLVLAASLLVNITLSVGRLGSVLAMQAQAMAPAAITTTAAISGVAALPLIMCFGSLGDKFGRRAAYGLAGVVAAIGAALLAGAAAPWQFWLAATLLLTAYCASSGLGAALATDVLAGADLGAMALYTATGSVAAVLSFASTGAAFAAFGPGPLFNSAALIGLASLALALLVGVRRPAPPRASGLAASGD